jgi:hypothetical protein
MASLAKCVMSLSFPSNARIIFTKGQQHLFLYHTLTIHNWPTLVLSLKLLLHANCSEGLCLFCPLFKTYVAVYFVEIQCLYQHILASLTVKVTVYRLATDHITVTVYRLASDSITVTAFEHNLNHLNTVHTLYYDDIYLFW